MVFSTLRSGLRMRRSRPGRVANYACQLVRQMSTTGLPSGPPAISKLLVANRGEIACRVISSARAMGIPSVAVYSEADRNAKHVDLADEAFCIGPAAARDSYLRTDRILEVAKKAGVDAVHPGYGFLSENTGFAAALEEAGIKFVGPPASAIRAMGDKSEAKAIMAAAGVPIVPGYHGADQGDERLQAEADRIGYPVLIKAVLGGGGKGMKLANSREEFMDALNAARREALAGFGDDVVLLERYIRRSRHVEVQVMADAHGSAVYLFERDCSVQRRHQKVIEEAPAPGVDPEFRRAIGEAAVRAALAVGYRNAGTVEFILDVDTGEYYFMEMNTRLQVEHPVTEAVTGVDLVDWQLRVAAGQPLPLSQDQLQLRGHAFEARIYAENPYNNFLPVGGTLLRWRPPPEAAEFSPAAVRVDAGVRAGAAVGGHYDPMVAKLIVHGPDRPSALRALRAALGLTQVAGLPSNIEFMRDVCANADFQQGGVDTGFIAKHEKTLLTRRAPPPEATALAALVYATNDARGAAARGLHEGSTNVWTPAPWDETRGFRLNHPVHEVVGFGTGAGAAGADIALTWLPDGGALLTGSVLGGSGLGLPDVDEAQPHVQVANVTVNDGTVRAEVDGAALTADYVVHAVGDEEILDLWLRGDSFQFRRPIVRRWERSGAASAAAAAGSVRSPMPGRVVKVFAAQGDVVTEGQPLVAVEAMKMEHSVLAPCSGTLTELPARVGAQVEDGQLLAVVEAVADKAPMAAEA